MSKKITPVLGERAEDVLAKIEQTCGADYPFEGIGDDDPALVEAQRANPGFDQDNEYKMAVEYVHLQVRELLNLGICLTPGQRESLRHDLRPVIARELIDRGYGEIFGVRESDTTDLDLYRVVNLLNGYKLKCEDCTNTQCPARDPSLAADKGRGGFLKKLTELLS